MTMPDTKNSRTHTTTWKKTETYLPTYARSLTTLGLGIGAEGEQYTLYCAVGLLSQLGVNVPQGVEVSMTDHSRYS